MFKKAKANILLFHFLFLGVKVLLLLGAVPLVYSRGMPTSRSGFGSKYGRVA